MGTGKKGHYQYDWSTDTKEKMVQLDFQITHATQDIHLTETWYRAILQEIAVKPYDEESKEMCKEMYAMIARTRDILYGKGLRLISYMMIKNWYECFSFGAEEMLWSFVYSQSEKRPPYGSWKDMKYFCDYCRNHPTHPWDDNHPLLGFVIRTLNHQLKHDWQQPPSTPVSLVAKWIPREKSKHAWLHTKLVQDYFPSYFTTLQTNEKAWKKAAMEYRKITSTLNQRLETVEVKQCAREWKDIDFHRVSAVALYKGTKAFLRETGTEDRIACRHHFCDFLESNPRKTTDTVTVGEITREAAHLYKAKPYISQEAYESRKKAINYLWTNHTKPVTSEYSLPLIDVSHSMQDQVYTAIGLGCQIAESSRLQNGVIVFSGHPRWIPFGPADTFVDRVEIILRDSVTGINTDFYSALVLVLDAMQESALKKKDIQQLTLVILSDMQMDVEFPFTQSLYETMEEKNHAFVPLPRVVFWNVRASHGFPCSPATKTVRLLSGPNKREGFKRTAAEYHEVKHVMNDYLTCQENSSGVK